MPTLVHFLFFIFLDSDIEVVERPGETADTPESESKELLDETKELLDENKSDKIQS